jgi:hypothetical protein
MYMVFPRNEREGGGFRGFAMGEPGQSEPAPTLVPSPI